MDNHTHDVLLFNILAALNAVDGTDPEKEHANADALLCQALRALGGGRIASAFEAASKRAGFWYA